MSRIDDALKLNNLNPEARTELKDAKQTVNDLASLAQVAGSAGGTVLLEMLREDCRDILTQMLNVKKAGEVGWQDKLVNSLLPDFEAKFTLFNTIKSAEKDYQEADQALEERLDEILEG